MDSVIMIFQQSDLNEEVQGGLEGFGLIPNFPLIRPPGTFSHREKFSFVL